MAGRASQTERANKLDVEVAALQNEVYALRRIIIGIDPALLENLNDPRPPPIDGFNDMVIPRIQAMGDLGMGEDQWIAEFGLTRTQWQEMKAQVPELVDAVEGAVQKALAWWHEKARIAQARSNIKFPLNLYRDMVDRLEKSLGEYTGGGGDRGDASKLVLLDLRSVGAVSKAPAASDEAEDTD